MDKAQRGEDPRAPEVLDRPYGDQETDYVVLEPEGPDPEAVESTGDLVADEEAAAAAEARAIGGAPVSDEISTPDFDTSGPDPAFEPVDQAGGGQAEGFEESEALLIEHAENPPEPELTADGFDLTDPGTDVDPDWEDTVAKDLSDLERTDEGALAQPRYEEARRASGRTGEPDEVDTTEVTFDPDEGADDPGRGPGVSFDR
jgi:hypothetical protein